MMIEILLITIFLLLASYAYRRRAKSRLACLIIIALCLGGILATLAPNSMTHIANILGVGRGADLVLYLFVITTVTLFLQYFLWMRDMEIRLTHLVRAQALAQAQDCTKDR